MFAIKNKITIDKIINFVKQIAPDTQVLSTEYLDEKSPLFFLCSCGKQFTKSWTTIQSVKTCKCRTCTRKDGWENKRRTSKEKDKWVKESINYGFTPLEPIKRIKDKFLCQDDNGYKGYISLENIRLNKHFSVFPEPEQLNRKDRVRQAFSWQSRRVFPEDRHGQSRNGPPVHRLSIQRSGNCTRRFAQRYRPERSDKCAEAFPPVSLPGRSRQFP